MLVFMETLGNSSAIKSCELNKVTPAKIKPEIFCTRMSFFACYTFASYTIRHLAASFSPVLPFSGTDPGFS
jgi:hypothetical protein